MHVTEIHPLHEQFQTRSVLKIEFEITLLQLIVFVKL